MRSIVVGLCIVAAMAALASWTRREPVPVTVIDSPAELPRAGLPKPDRGGAGETTPAIGVQPIVSIEVTAAAAQVPSPRLNERVPSFVLDDGRSVRRVEQLLLSDPEFVRSMTELMSDADAELEREIGQFLAPLLEPGADR